MSSRDYEELDPKERKRYLNRIAQRNYRRNQKQRLQALEATVRQLSDRDTSNTTATARENSSDGNSQHDESSFLSENDNIISHLDIPILQHDLARSKITSGTVSSVSDGLYHSISDDMILSGTQSTMRRTALHRAVCKGDESMTRLLLQAGADVEALDIDGYTAFHRAVEIGNEKMIKLLLQNGVNPNTKDSMGRTALFQAVQSDNEVIVRLLLDAHIDANCKDITGEVALHLAVERSSNSIAILLLTYGADIDA